MFLATIIGKLSECSFFPPFMAKQARRILRGVGCKVSAWEQWGAARDYQRAARPVAAYPAAAYPVAAWRCESVGNERVG